jgi:hypothetical protein
VLITVSAQPSLAIASADSATTDEESEGLTVPEKVVLNLECNLVGNVEQHTLDSSIPRGGGSFKQVLRTLPTKYYAGCSLVFSTQREIQEHGFSNIHLSCYAYETLGGYVDYGQYQLAKFPVDVRFLSLGGDMLRCKRL